MDITSDVLKKPINYDGIFRFEFLTDFDIIEIKLEMAHKPATIQLKELIIITFKVFFATINSEYEIIVSICQYKIIGKKIWRIRNR